MECWKSNNTGVSSFNMRGQKSIGLLLPFTLLAAEPSSGPQFRVPEEICIQWNHSAKSPSAHHISHVASEAATKARAPHLALAGSTKFQSVSDTRMHNCAFKLTKLNFVPMLKNHQAPIQVQENMPNKMIEVLFMSQMNGLRNQYTILTPRLPHNLKTWVCHDFFLVQLSELLKYLLSPWLSARTEWSN